MKEPETVTDMRALLAGHDILYKTPPRRIRDALPVGNGRFGALVYQPAHWEWVIEKLDVTLDHHKDHSRHTDPSRFVINDHRADLAIPYTEKLKAVKARDKARLLAIKAEQARRVRKLEVMQAAPTSLPAGRFRINVVPAYLEMHGDTAEADALHHRLDLFRGEVFSRTGTGKARRTVRTFCDQEKDLLCVAAQAGQGALPVTRIVLRRPPHDALPQTAPRFLTSGNRIWVDYPFANHFRYVVMAQVDGAAFDVTKRADAVVAHLRDPGGELTVMVTCVTCLETDDPPALAGSILDSADAGRVRRANRKTWRGFWNRSAIRIDDDITENLFYFNQYAFNCTHGRGMRAKYKAAGLYGLWPHADSTQWSNHVYCDANIEMAYQHAFTSNHVEQADAFTDMVWAHLPTARAVARKVFKRPGACFGELYFCAGPWYCSLLWDYYTHTGDLDYLRYKAYPVMKEAADFSIAMMEKGTDGRYFLFGDRPPERGDGPSDRTDTMGFGGYYKNVTISLAFIKSLLKHLVQASRVLKVDEDLVPTWRDVLNHFPAYPTGVTEFGEALFDAAEFDKPTVTHHAATVAAVYPTGELHFSSPAKKSALGRATMLSAWENCRYRYTFTIPWIAAGMARMGLGDKAEELIRKWSVDVLTDPSGFMGREVGPRYAPWINGNYGYRPGDAPLLEVGCGLLSAINEMLLQERNGHLFLFPALPSSWNHAAFRDLRVPGAFLVSAAMAAGDVTHVRIRAERSGSITVHKPWKQGCVLQHDKGTKQTFHTDIPLRLAAGETVLLRPRRPAHKRLPRHRHTPRPKSRLTAQGFHLLLGMNETSRVTDAVERFCFPSTIARGNQSIALASGLRMDSYWRIHMEIPKDIYYRFNFGGTKTSQYAPWFGTGQKFPFLPVTPTTRYARRRHCGWDPPQGLSRVRVPGKDPISRTAIRGKRPAVFMLELNEGFYQCLLVHGAGPDIRTRLTLPRQALSMDVEANERVGIDEFGLRVEDDVAVPIEFRAAPGAAWQVHALLVKRAW